MKGLRWVAALFLLLTVLALLYRYLPPRKNLAALAAPAAAYDVEIVRDVWGVPHIFGVSDADAAFGLAYAHAEDDFFTIQQMLVAARGELASIYGADAAPNDYMVALLRIWQTVDSQYEHQLSPEVRALCEAYAAGLNLYASQHPNEAFANVFPATGKDVVAGSLHKSPLFFGLDGTLGKLFSEVEGSVQRFDALAAGNTGIGSNVFAVSPARTADGSTMLAVNSHQPWTGPVAWYEAHVQSDAGWNAVGALFPGMPLITLGHNEVLGWGFTVNSPDLTDVYRLTLNPDNPDQYLFDGEWRTFETRAAPITVNLLTTIGLGDPFGRALPWTVRRDVSWSVYGPVIRNDEQAFAIRYAAFDSIAIYEQLYRMNRATTFDEWRAALQRPGLPMFNVGYADHQGNIYYLYNALLPERTPGYNWQDVLPGDSSDTLWTSYVPFGRLPQLLNPPSGFIQNANSSPFETTFDAANPDAAAYPDWMGIETRMTNRALRLRELFEADPSVEWSEFVRYKYDMRFSQQSDLPQFIARIGGFSFDRPIERRAVTVLQAWDLEASPTSPGAALAMLTLLYLNEDGNISISGLVGSEISDATLKSAFEQAVRLIEEHHFGRLDVAWSQVNRLRRGTVNLGIGGAPDVPHAVYGELDDAGRLVGIAGDSYIMLVRWDADGTLSSYSIHQYGAATLDADSPHYADQAPLFVQRKLKPVFFDEATVRANAERVYRPQQEGR